MKSLRESLFDDDLVTKDVCLYRPKTRSELVDFIGEQLKIQGPNANLNVIDVSKITDMAFIFNPFAHEIKNIDISLWNVKNVTTFGHMFQYCMNFNCDLSKWDTRSASNMYGMFDGCSSFNSDLSKWDVRKLVLANYMFRNCTNFNCDLSKWNTNKLEYMMGMFRGCKSLKKIPSWYHEES